MSSETESTPRIWRVTEGEENHDDADHEFEFIGSGGQAEYHECTICGEIVIVQYSFW